VSEELGHEGNAETSDLAVGFAFGVEVGTTLASSHTQASQSILECLLEAKELEDGKIDRGMETESTFVRTECRVILKECMF
jgi:hypothetical protein